MCTIMYSINKHNPTQVRNKQLLAEPDAYSRGLLFTRVNKQHNRARTHSGAMVSVY